MGSAEAQGAGGALLTPRNTPLSTCGERCISRCISAVLGQAVLALLSRSA